MRKREVEDNWKTFLRTLLSFRRKAIEYKFSMNVRLEFLPMIHYARCSFVN